MANQAGTFEELEARDTTVVGEAAKPEAGLDAKFNYEGTPIDRDRLQSILSNILQDADRYRMKFMAEILRDYNQYNGQVDDTAKGEWQSRLHVPLAKQAVDISSSRVVDAIFSNEDFFDVYPYTKIDDIRVESAKKIIKWQFYKAGIREGVRTSIKNAFICGFGPAKITFEQKAEQETGVLGGQFQDVVKLKKGLRVDPIMPSDIWLDPTGRNRFIIHRVKRSLSDLWAMARAQQDPVTGEIIPPVYDPEVVEDLTPGLNDPEQDVRDSQIRRDTPYLASDMGLDVYEYWGDIYDPKNGVVLYRNVVCTFVGKGKTRLIREPQKNPFRHGKAPFIVFTPGLAPHQIYGWGLLRSVSLVSDAIDRQFNVILDKTLLQVPMVIVYPTALRNPDELKGDKPVMKPGKMWQGKDPERTPFEAIEGFPPPTQQDFTVLDRLVGFYQQATGVNEFATGTPQTINRKTKEEVQIRAGATQQVFNDSAQHIEENALSPLVRMVYDLTVQFEDQFDDQRLMRMFGDDENSLMYLQALMQMTPEQRWETMSLDAEFRVTGISLSISRDQKLQRIQGFLQAVAQDPIMAMLLDREALLREFTKLYDMPRNIILPPAGAILQAQSMGQVGMLMQQFGLMPKGTGGMQNNQTDATREAQGNPNAEESSQQIENSQAQA